MDLPQAVTKKPFDNLLKKLLRYQPVEHYLHQKNAARKLILLMQKENPESVNVGIT